MSALSRSSRSVRTIVATLTSAVALAALFACSADPLSPPALPTVGPAPLLGPNEGVRLVTDSVDAYGNTILVQEFGIGYYTLPNGDSAPVGGVVIKSVIPMLSPTSTTSSSACITHSIVRTEITPGNSLTVKKSGGCDKDIVILVEQKATRLKATFSFSMVFGKTVIDSGVLR